MREIQIICVNDGSPDGSRNILQEYADRDSRIEIIDKPNGGLSSARNAAYSHIKGKYTLFVDSDDWIDLDTCEKTYQKAETTGAPMTVFLYQVEGSQITPTFQQVTSADKTTVEEKFTILDWNSAWSKLWRTDFLLVNRLYFPEGLCFEDVLVNWKAVTLADKISVIRERFYHYRCNSDSIMTKKGEHHMQIVAIYNNVCEYLHESDYYVIYREKFITTKLYALHRHYSLLPASLKPRFAAMVRDSLTEDDRDFCRTASNELLPKLPRLFRKMIDGCLIDAILYHNHVSQPIRSIIKFPERLLRQYVIKPLKKRLKAA
jgi:glycosyltransferase involved in cell wall biosynthesis